MLLLTGILGLAWGSAAYERPTRFLVISSPGTQNVLYTLLPSLGDLTLPESERPIAQANVLIDGQVSRCQSSWSCTFGADEGLQEPSSLALWQVGGGPGRLYVADSKAQKVYAYRVQQTWDGWSLERTGSQSVIRSNLPEGQVSLALDGFGNLFLARAEDGSIEMIKVDKLVQDNPQGTVLYAAANFPGLATPRGLVADSFHVFWGNQKGTPKTGVVMKASIAKASPPVVLSNKSDEYEALATHLCLARDKVFFTGDAKSVFAVKTSGGAAADVCKLSKPQGCVYDDESTIFVADSGDDSVYSFAANFDLPHKVNHLTKVASVKSPMHLVIFSGLSSDPNVRALQGVAAPKSAGIALLLLCLSAIWAA